MKGVAIVAERGGSGKTSLAHALAFGAAWNNVPAYLMHTDDREPLKVDGRPYAYFDARSPEKLQSLIEASLTSDGLFIVDSGGNRPAFDKWITEAMDLVIVPIKPDAEDVATNLKHIERLQAFGRDNVRVILNACPSNKFEREFVQEVWKPVPSKLVIGVLPNMPAIRMLRMSDKEPFSTPPTKINKFARYLYEVINRALENGGKPMKNLKEVI